MRNYIFIITILLLACSTKKTKPVEEMYYSKLSENVIKELNYVKTTFFKDENIKIIGQVGIKSRFFIYSFTTKSSFVYALSDKKKVEIDFELLDYIAIKNINIDVKKNITAKNYISGYHDFILCDYERNKINDGFMFYGSYLNWQGNDLDLFRRIIKELNN